MRFAKTAAAMEPTNNVKAAEALLAEQTAMTARAELDAQNARAHAVKERIKVVRSNRRSRRQVKASAAPARSVPSVRAAFAPTPTPRAPAPAPVKAIQQIQPAPVPAPTPVKTTVPEPKIVAPAPKPAAAVIVTPAIAPQAASLRHNSANRSNAVAKTPVAMPPAAPAPIPTLTAKKKLAVAAAADVTAPAKPTRPVAPAPAASTAPPTPTIVHKPTTAFRAAQANKAAQVETAVSGPAKQECPNCYAKVPATAKRCRCGFEMPLFSSQIPSLAMSPEDRAAFLAALAPTGNDKNR